MPMHDVREFLSSRRWVGFSADGRDAHATENPSGTFIKANPLFSYLDKWEELRGLCGGMDCLGMNAVSRLIALEQLGFVGLGQATGGCFDSWPVMNDDIARRDGEFTTHRHEGAIQPALDFR